MGGAFPVSSSGRAFDDSVVFAGGRLCLDFVNTACENRGAPMEFLGDAAALRRWLRSAEGLYGKEGGGWDRHVDATSLVRAHALRGALRDLVQGVLEGRPPSASALERVNAALGAAPSYLRLGFAENGFRSSVHVEPSQEPWLSEIARDAVDFLCGADLSLLRKCGCETCVRVFYDTTKNHRRRWCVEKCGSRVKAASYYRRKRAQAKNDAEGV